MKSELETLLESIAAEQRGCGEMVEAPAPKAASARADIYVRDRFAIPLPSILSSLWEIRDGVYFNGMMIYRPTEDERPVHRYSFCSTNETYAEVTGTRYLFVGEADMDAFVHDTLEGGWHMADKVSLDSFERFDTCEALLLAVLRKYLEI